MISRIIDFSARNRFIVLTLIAAAAVYGWWSMNHVALDAIPDLSDTQVIVYSRWDRSPDIVEDEVTYPIVSAMLGAPKVRAVRGFSDFGYSFVYVIFEDGTDIYWARTRTLEYLSGVIQSLPPGARTELPPDATGLGWIYHYVLGDNSGKHSLADLRSLQDWYLRYHLKSVAEVAPIGGFGKQYQVNVDSNRLQSHNILINKVVDAIRASNEPVCRCGSRAGQGQASGDVHRPGASVHAGNRHHAEAAVRVAPAIFEVWKCIAISTEKRNRLSGRWLSNWPVRSLGNGATASGAQPVRDVSGVHPGPAKWPLQPVVPAPVAATDRRKSRGRRPQAAAPFRARVADEVRRRQRGICNRIQDGIGSDASYSRPWLCL